MISLTRPVEEYELLSNDEKRDVFASLAERILIMHPEYLEEAKRVEMSDLCRQIQEETENAKLLTKKEERKVQKLLKKIRY